MHLRTIILALVQAGASACVGDARASIGPAVRLSSGVADTIIVNGTWPAALPVRALDGQGRVVTAAPIRYDRIAGSATPVSSSGVVHCGGSGDVTVRVTMARLESTLLVRCRPVKWVRIPGPMQFILGDSATRR